MFSRLNDGERLAAPATMVFRDAITPGQSLLELERCAGTQFDPVVVAIFQRIVRT